MALENQQPRQIGRSIGAILAGFVVVILLSIGTDVALRAAGVFPPLTQVVDDKLLLLATVYRTIYGVLGSYVTAHLAPYRPMLHAMVGGAIGFVLAIVGAVVTWNQGPAFGPHWYPLTLLALALPQSWLGGKLRENQLRTEHAA